MGQILSPKRSVELDGGQLQLQGDADAPSNSTYYGLDSGGTYGFHANVVPSGTPLVDQVSYWTDANTVKGDPHLRFLSSSDLTIHEDVNDGNPSVRVGSADDEESHFQAVYDSGLQTLDYLRIWTQTASAVADKGRIVFGPDETNVCQIDDDGLEMASGKGITTTTGALSITTGGGNGDIDLTPNGTGRIVIKNLSYLDTGLDHQVNIAPGEDLTADRTLTLFMLDNDASFNMRASAGSLLLGRGSGGAGSWQNITLGANLTMTGTVLSASGGSPGGASGDVQYNDGASGFAGESAFNYTAGSNLLRGGDTCYVGDIAVTASTGRLAASGANAEVGFLDRARVSFSLAAGDYWAWYSSSNIAKFWSGSNWIFVKKTGQVGIGEADPTAKLSVSGADSGSPFFSQVIVKGVSGGDCAVGLESQRLSTTQRWFFGTGSGAGSTSNFFRIVDLTAGNKDRFNINPVTKDVYIGGDMDGVSAPGDATLIVGLTSITIKDAHNVVLGTTTGTKIGTATSQKLGFFNKAPVQQLQKASYNNWAALSDVVQALVDIGLFDQA